MRTNGHANIYENENERGRKNATTKTKLETKQNIQHKRETKPTYEFVKSKQKENRIKRNKQKQFETPQRIKRNKQHINKYISTEHMKQKIQQNTKRKQKRKNNIEGEKNGNEKTTTKKRLEV